MNTIRTTTMTKDENMTTQTLDKKNGTTEAEDVREVATPASKKAAKEHKPSKLAGVLRGLTPEKSSAGFPVLIWTVFFRLVVLIADYLLVLSTAIALIPMLGAWLHQQSGDVYGDLTMAGTIAMWIAPLLFLVLVLAAAEIAVMRAMWRWASRRIQSIRDARAGDAVVTTPRTNSQNKNANRKRSN